MENCFLFKLNGVVDNENLPTVNELVFDVKNISSKLQVYYGGKVSSPLAGDVVISVTNGTIDQSSSNTITIQRGTSVGPYTKIDITPQSTTSNVTVKINDCTLLNGFGVNTVGFLGDNNPLSMDKICSVVNGSKFSIPYYLQSINLSTMIETLIENGNTKSSIVTYCYANNDYDVYTGDTKINVAGKEITANINNTQTEYTLENNGTILAKKVYSGGVWSNVSIA